MNKMRGFNQIMCSLALFVCRQEFFYVFGFKFFIVNKLESFHFGYNRNERGWKREGEREERKVGLIVFGPLAKSFAASSETILICSYSFVYLLKSLSLTLFLFPALIHALFFLKCCFHHALVDYFSSPFSVCVCVWVGGWMCVRFGYVAWNSWNKIGEKCYKIETNGQILLDNNDDDNSNNSRCALIHPLTARPTFIPTTTNAAQLNFFLFPTILLASIALSPLARVYNQSDRPKH